MFRYNQKNANREVDELKKLLAITKGMRTPAKSISSSFLREDVGMTGNPLDPSAAQGAEDATTVDVPTPEEMADTDAQSAFEKATNDSKVTEMSDKLVKAEKYEGKLEFTYDIEKEKPTATISDELELDDDVITTFQKVKEYFKTWKDNAEKAPQPSA
jgi:hypothetical protein